MEDSVAVIAKNEEEALSILEGLEHDDIIDAFDEEYEEVDNKENALRLAAAITQTEEAARSFVSDHKLQDEVAGNFSVRYHGIADIPGSQ